MKQAIMNEDAELEESNELFEHYHFKVDRGQSLLRIDKFVASRIENISRNRIQTAADANCILVNSKPVKSSYRVKPLDEISIVMPYEKRHLEILPENIPLNIVHEDNDLIVVYKEAGMVVHPGHGNYSGTLVNAILWRLEQQGQHLLADDERGGLLVHRIDKNTSGLMIVAKNNIAHAKLAQQFFLHTVKRKYIALVWGAFDQPAGTLTGYIGRSRHDRMKMKIYDEPEQGKHAVTHYKVLEKFDYVSLIECVLETGRTHQIRAHMEHIGHPLFNDERYGGDKILKGTTFSKYKQFVTNCFTALPRQALHAGLLGFVHPSTNREMIFEAELAPDMQNVIDRWRNYVKYRTE